MFSGFTLVVLNNTFPNRPTFRGTLNSVRFYHLSLTPKVQRSEISKREETQQIIQLFFGWVLSVQPQPQRPPLYLRLQPHVLIIKYQHLAAVVNLSRHWCPPALPWKPRGHCLSPWCSVWWKRDGTKSLAGFTCCGFVVLCQGNWG